MPLPVLLVGCGRWGRNILRDLAQLGRPVVVVDTSPDALAAAAPLALATRPSLDIGERLAGIVVATPATDHVATIEQVARWQLPIFVEKPLAIRDDDAERVVALTGERLFVMDKWRYHPGVEALGALARGGALGPVRALRTWRLGWGHAHEDVDPIWTLLPHDLSIVREILGFLPPAVHAIAERDREHVWGMAARLGSDPACAIEVSARHPERRRRIEVVFDGAVAILDGDRDTMIRLRSDSGERTIACAGDPPLKRELEAFVRHLDGGPPPKSSARDGAEAVRRISELRRLAGFDG
ncbi:MAG TPA: Gfo/Idh/MocA family oxidoreductase [Casimicrobiaceae bacterium]|nr:Gfo/Idh/MocA family oxidoreductase [Casimicrobiaceae bacterium]